MYRVIFLVGLLAGCSGMKQDYDNRIYDKSNPKVLYQEKKLKISQDETVIFFTYGFKADRVKLTVNDTIIVEKEISSVNEIGFATMEHVKRKFPVVLQINSRENLTISTKKLNSYKFIYISKNLDNGKLLVMYTNIPKSF